MEKSEKEITAKSSKTDMFEAYQEALKKLKEPEGMPIKQIKEEKEKKEVVDKASKFTIDAIIKQIAELKLGLSYSLDQLEQSLIAEFKKLMQLQDAIKIESKNIEDIYQIKANAETLSALLLAQKEKKIQFEVEMTEKKTLWEKEQKEHDVLNKENDILLKKQRQREEEEYTYNIQLIRKKEQEAYNHQKITQEKQLVEQKVVFEKQMKEREFLVASKEKEFTELIQKVETFAIELDKSIKQTEKTVTEKLQSQYKFEKDMSAKEFESDQKLKTQIITTLEAKIKEQSILISQLTTKADTSSNQVKEIAIKALESSGSIRSIIKEKEDKN